MREDEERLPWDASSASVNFENFVGVELHKACEALPSLPKTPVAVLVISMLIYVYLVLSMMQSLLAHRHDRENGVLVRKFLYRKVGGPRPL